MKKQNIKLINNFFENFESLEEIKILIINLLREKNEINTELLSNIIGSIKIKLSFAEIVMPKSIPDNTILRDFIVTKVDKNKMDGIKSN
jgi:hypothetical protein